jgi:hypothetical protein
MIKITVIMKKQHHDSVRMWAAIQSRFTDFGQPKDDYYVERIYPENTWKIKPYLEIIGNTYPVVIFQKEKDEHRFGCLKYDYLGKIEGHPVDLDKEINEILGSLK